ncbi:hypothetical protein JOQ06_015123, partial [Pogonophryne albipinna]
DQFDNLEKHTSCGIDFLERYSKFLRERADIELSYAKQIRSREDESRYSWCLAFAATLRQLNELSVQREEFAENLNTQIVCELTRYTQEVKTERKNHFQDGRRAQQHIEGSWKQLESSKRRFERDCKEAERAQQVSDRIDLDNKTDGEKRCSLKARQTAQQKKQAAEESRKDYVTSLNQFNQDQHQHYHTLVPVIYQRIQDMEERRIERVCEAMRSSAEAERKVLPAAGRSLEVMMEAAEGIQPRMDARQVVEVYKSGFDPPGDGSGPADCSHLPPEQRRKKLQSRMNNINQEIQREREQRDALLKMREVYERSPQMGDAGSLEPRLEEAKLSLQRLEEELRKHQCVTVCAQCVFSVYSVCLIVSFPSADRQLPISFPSANRQLPVSFPSANRQLPISFPSANRQLPVSFPSASHQLPVSFPSASRQLIVSFPSADRQLTVS